MTTEAEQQEVWARYYDPKVKMPGSFEPIDGKCGAAMRDKRTLDLGFTRYCTKRAGMGTNHLNAGRCKFHGGASPSGIVSATRELVHREVGALAAVAGEPEALGPPEVEYLRIAAEARQFREIVKQRVAELESPVVMDKAGVEHVRAMIELFERATDRIESMLQFMLRFDLDKRVQALEEQQVNLIVAGFMAVILDVNLGLSQAQVDDLRKNFAMKMAELGEGIAPTWTNPIKDADVIDVDAWDEEGAINDAEVVES